MRLELLQQRLDVLLRLLERGPIVVRDEGNNHSSH